MAGIEPAVKSATVKGISFRTLISDLLGLLDVIVQFVIVRGMAKQNIT